MKNTGNQTAFVGAEGTLSAYLASHRDPTFEVFAEAYSDGAGTGIVELPSVINMSTGMYFATIDPLKGQAGYVADSLYPDLTRYLFDFSLSNSVTTGGSTSSLVASEWSVVMIASTLADEGYTVCVALYSDQTALQSFCRHKGWHFEVLSRRD